MSEQNEALLQKESSFIVQLAHELGIVADAKRIYGEPVEQGSLTVIPVAKVGYGFGGGGGKKEKKEGGGGGGGLGMIPVGYIEIKNGETRFRPTRDPLAFVPAILAAAPLVLLTVWKITKLFRRDELK